MLNIPKYEGQTPIGYWSLIIWNYCLLLGYLINLTGISGTITGISPRRNNYSNIGGGSTGPPSSPELLHTRRLRQRQRCRSRLTLLSRS